MIMVRSLSEAQGFSSSLCVQTVSGAHPASCTMAVCRKSNYVVTCLHIMKLLIVQMFQSPVIALLVGPNILLCTLFPLKSEERELS
jgi:hypothetical protein